MMNSFTRCNYEYQPAQSDRRYTLFLVWPFWLTLHCKFCFDYYLVFAAADSTWFLLLFHWAWRGFSRWVTVWWVRRAGHLSFLGHALCWRCVWKCQTKLRDYTKPELKPLYKSTSGLPTYLTLVTFGSCWDLHSFCCLFPLFLCHTNTEEMVCQLNINYSRRCPISVSEDLSLGKTSHLMLLHWKCTSMKTPLKCSTLCSWWR